MLSCRDPVPLRTGPPPLLPEINGAGAKCLSQLQTIWFQSLFIVFWRGVRRFRGGVGKPACPLGAEVSGWRAFELDYDSCIFIIISYVCEKMSSVGRLISEMDNPLFVCDRNPEARFLFRIVRN